MLFPIILILFFSTLLELNACNNYLKQQMLKVILPSELWAVFLCFRHNILQAEHWKKLSPPKYSFKYS